MPFHPRTLPPPRIVKIPSCPSAGATSEREISDIGSSRVASYDCCAPGSQHSNQPARNAGSCPPSGGLARPAEAGHYGRFLERLRRVFSVVVRLQPDLARPEGVALHESHRQLK